MAQSLPRHGSGIDGHFNAAISPAAVQTSRSPALETLRGPNGPSADPRSGPGRTRLAGLIRVGPAFLSSAMDRGLQSQRMQSRDKKRPAQDLRALQKGRTQRREALWRGLFLVFATICIALSALLIGHEGLLQMGGLLPRW